MQIKEQNLGLIYGVMTYLMWGLFPIYFKLLNEVNSLEILASRIFWASAFLFLLIKLKKKSRNLKLILLNKKITISLIVAGIFVCSNWGIYIYAVNTDRILETSLGYFINPLMSMLLGAIILKERLSKVGKISVCIVVIAIAVQIYSLGKLPLISLTLPVTFAIYGVIKKRLSVPTIEGLFIETCFLSVFALFYIVIFGDVLRVNFGFSLNGLLLVSSGLVTMIPLLTFNEAALRIKLITLGFLQYISPSISMLVAIFIYGEELNIYKLISFLLIWFSLILVSTDGIIHFKKGEK
ncbi:MAG: EamA family transporter RarD [Campylobacter sp.]|nr:EamA family transporter RarD [Campylobacter sp.]